MRGEQPPSSSAAVSDSPSTIFSIIILLSALPPPPLLLLLLLLLTLSASEGTATIERESAGERASEREKEAADFFSPTEEEEEEEEAERRGRGISIFSAPACVCAVCASCLLLFVSGAHLAVTPPPLCRTLPAWLQLWQAASLLDLLPADLWCVCADPNAPLLTCVLVLVCGSS